MYDLTIAILQALGASIPVLLLLLVALIIIWLLQHRVRIEIDEDACSTYVDFQAGRVYRSIVYKLKYPEKLAFLCLWPYDLKFEYLPAPQFLQVERLGYLLPGHDPLRDDEPVEFSELGKLETDFVVDAEGRRQRVVQQVVPMSVAREALGRRSKVLWFYPICRLRGVDTVVMDIRYPLEEVREELDELVTVEDNQPAPGILRFVIRKREGVKKVYNYKLRYRLPGHIGSFDSHVEYSPLEANLPTRPEDISVISTCSLDHFDRTTPTESYELDWMFSITHDAIEVRLQYS